MSSSASFKLLKVIDKETFTLLEDRTRRNILQLLREEELTVKEIAKRLEVTPQNVYYHLKRMTDAGLVSEVKEKWSGHLIESYYTATADTYVYHEDEIPSNDIHEYIEILNGLNELSGAVEVSEENAEKLAEFSKRREKILKTSETSNGVCGACSFSGYFMKLGPMNPILVGRVLQLNSVISMSDEEFEETLRITRELRKFLISIKTSEKP
jgi:DNA-binding transcriptional ArsR family regulator